MAEFITTGVQEELARLRKAGLTLPNSPQQAVEKVRSMNASVRSGATGRAIASQMGQVKTVGHSGMRRTSSGAGSVQMSLEKVRGPLDRFNASQIPYDISKREERTKIRDLCRIYYSTHNLVPLCVDMYTRFPLAGMSIKCKDPDMVKFYEQLFFDQLDYETFLIDAGREFFTTGEVNMLGSFNETLGVWESEQIINPDLLTVTISPFSSDPRYRMAVSEEIKQIIETREPKADYAILVREYPEVVKAARQGSSQTFSDDALGEGLEISDVLLSRIVNKVSPWDVYGTPHIMRIFTLLNLEEGLYAAQKAIADRLYSPLILAKLGSPDLGDGEAWVPSEDQLQAFTDQMSQAMAADFRFLAYHFGIEIESVFGRESVPRFDQDFDRIESKMLEVWGIGESLISGSQGQGAYASSALNAELMNSMMKSYQLFLQRHFRKRAEVVAEAQGHFDYTISNGVRTLIMEEYIEIDDDGEEYVRRRPKLLVPELQFAALNLRDEGQQRSFLTQLKGMGVPVSDRALMVNMDIDFEEEIERIQLEKIQKLTAEQETIQKAIKVLQARQLPIPPELLTAMAQQNTPPPPMPPGAPQLSMPLGQDITSPVNTPTMTTDENAGPIAQQNASIIPVDLSGVTAGAAPQSPGISGQMPPAPSAPDVPSYPGSSAAQGDSSDNLPQNWIRSRPEISDNMRAGMPRPAARTTMRRDPSVIGQRSLLSSDSVSDVINDRPWVRYLNRKVNP